MDAKLFRSLGGRTDFRYRLQRRTDQRWYCGFLDGRVDFFHRKRGFQAHRNHPVVAGDFNNAWFFYYYREWIYGLGFAQACAGSTNDILELSFDRFGVESGKLYSE